MIEIMLTCDVCGVKTDPFQGGIVDTYEWHDAPYDAVTLEGKPQGWWADPDPFSDDSPGLLALCPDHNTREARTIPALRHHRRNT